jgi:hypothetical protein
MFREGGAISHISLTLDSAKYRLPDYNHLRETIHRNGLVVVRLGWSNTYIDV